MSFRKRAIQIAVFLIVMALTFYALFHGQNPGKIWKAVLELSPVCLILAVCLGLFFVSAEGFMIWYLLRSMEKDRREKPSGSLARCIQYSFIGFFYSGITPSATGGQPVQLYYMNRDGYRGSDSAVVLMTVALAYKLVLVLIGAGILLFWGRPLKTEFGSCFPLYLLGMFLNTLLVCAILCVMLFPRLVLGIAYLAEGFLVRLHVLKVSESRKGKILVFIERYGQAVKWLKGHRRKVALVLFLTLIQRCSVFLLTYVIYLGFGMKGTGAAEVMMLQASVYIAVDMLPLPGAQGITELVYQTVFDGVFPASYLIPSMMVSRGINFYFLLLVSLSVVIFSRLSGSVRKKTE